MIRVIDGKRYSTETAELVHAHSNGHFRSDFNFRAKFLYRTKSGAWFLHHEGGPMSDMSVSVGNNGIGGSESIEPVSEDDAYGFLEVHSDDPAALQALEKHFSDRVQDA